MKQERPSVTVETFAEMRTRIGRGGVNDSERLALREFSQWLQSIREFCRGWVSCLLLAESEIPKEFARKGGKTPRRDDSDRSIDREEVQRQARRLLSAGTESHNLASILERTGLGSARRIRPILQKAGILPKK